MTFKNYKSDPVLLVPKSLAGCSRSQRCRRTRCRTDSHCGEGSGLSLPVPPVPPLLVWGHLAVVQAELCFPASVLSSHSGCLILELEQTQKTIEKRNLNGSDSIFNPPEGLLCTHPPSHAPQPAWLTQSWRKGREGAVRVASDHASGQMSEQSCSSLRKEMEGRIC